MAPMTTCHRLAVAFKTATAYSAALFVGLFGLTGALVLIEGSMWAYGVLLLIAAGLLWYLAQGIHDTLLVEESQRWKGEE